MHRCFPIGFDLKVIMVFYCGYECMMYDCDGRCDRVMNLTEADGIF